MGSDGTSAAPVTGSGATAGPRRGRARERTASPAGGGAVYGLGMIGAMAYFAAAAESPRDYVLAFLKATIWPALLVFRAFKRLGDEGQGQS